MKKTLVLLTLSLVIMAALHCSSTIALALPANGLVAWWEGEGNANDAVGVNHGTLVGGVRFAPGKVGQAFHLNGVNAYVDLGTALDVPSWPNYAVSLWFQHDGGGTVAGGPGQKIIDKTVLFHDFWIVVHTHFDGPPPILALAASPFLPMKAGGAILSAILPTTIETRPGTT